MIDGLVKINIGYFQEWKYFSLQKLFTDVWNTYIWMWSFDDTEMQFYENRMYWIKQSYCKKKKFFFTHV